MVASTTDESSTRPAEYLKGNFKSDALVAQLLVEIQNI